jgi:hypothetical protein
VRLEVRPVFAFRKTKSKNAIKLINKNERFNENVASVLLLG